MCGIIGVYGHTNCILELYEGLLCIQHRGQDAAGIMTYDNTSFHLKKGFGLVRDVFKEKHILRLNGGIGIGHVRYPTVGTGSKQDAQPFYVNTPYGIAMAHNGNVTNYLQLKKELLEENLRHLNSSCDVEVILNVFADALLKQNTKKLRPDHIFKAVDEVYKRCKGSYSVVGIIGGKGLLLFRDPHGIKPLILGQKGDKKINYAAASESVALDIMGYDEKRDVQPGEVIFIDENMKVHSKVLVKKEHTPCIFEYIYFARPDSLMDKISVYKTRLRLGRELAVQWKSLGLNVDSVIPIPESSRTAASSLSEDTGINYREGFVKNRYIGRTFIMPNQAERTLSVKRKLNPIKLEFKGKDVLLVDDSIVRGTTSKKIIEMARNAGAKKVYL